MSDMNIDHEERGEENSKQEGEMTRRRAAIVRRETLARIAVRIGLGRFLFLGKGEESTGGRNKIPNLAGAIEAVIAAVFLDLGMPTTSRMGGLSEPWSWLAATLRR